jgi:hypothetical protein
MPRNRREGDNIPHDFMVTARRAVEQAVGEKLNDSRGGNPDTVSKEGNMPSQRSQSKEPLDRTAS